MLFIKFSCSSSLFFEKHDKSQVKILKQWINFNFCKYTFSPSFCYLPLTSKTTQKLSTLLHSTSWKFSISWKFGMHIIYDLKMALSTLLHSDQGFIKNIFTPLCLKSETTAHVQLTISCYYILFTNFLIWYLLENHIEDNPWLMGSTDEVINIITWHYLEILFGEQLLTCSVNLHTSYEV